MQEREASRFFRQPPRKKPGPSRARTRGSALFPTTAAQKARTVTHFGPKVAEKARHARIGTRKAAQQVQHLGLLRWIAPKGAPLARLSSRIKTARACEPTVEFRYPRPKQRTASKVTSCFESTRPTAGLEPRVPRAAIPDCSHSRRVNVRGSRHPDRSRPRPMPANTYSRRVSVRGSRHPERSRPRPCPRTRSTPGSRGPRVAGRGPALRAGGITRRPPPTAGPWLACRAVWASTCASGKSC